MNKPRDEDINRVIAEFMGLNTWSQPNNNELRVSDFNKTYTTSLDACIPVVEKLMSEPQSFKCFCWMNKYHENECEVDTRFGKHKVKNFKDKSPARALALAIYEVLKDER